MITLISVEQKEERKTIVKMGDWAVEQEDSQLVILGLGSCIGVALYDDFTKIGGLAHVMLPKSKGKKKAEAKYADTAVPFLLEKMIEKGAKRRRLKAKIVGGAGMFKTEGGQSVMQIGKKNIEAVKEVLKNQKIRIVGSDLAKDYGRSMYFHLTDGKVRVTAFNKENITI
ncbi:chemotaxis protein CheD [Halanaerobium congolense]|uniref:Probable chemoreceptor glutamine deamidase CheD n=1 Tax=Halanaerobium congolense TaxID=54121 RepID=A0A4R8G6Y9_9FIRM|nr:chemotaxis protein CheD [Halanaerobium congolense]